MKKLIKKILSLIMAIAVISAAFSVTSAYAAEEEKVKVVVKNEVFSTDDGAAWDGTLVDEWVEIDENSTLMSAVVNALDNHGYTQKGAENCYIEEINGLAAYDGGEMSGWMGTVNDWFANVGFDAFTVANGTLESGDEICIMYSNSWGADIGSDWSNNDSSLSRLVFSEGTLSADFVPSTTEYTLTLPADVTRVFVTPTAANKNFQVRTYKNEYTPNVEKSEYKRTQSIDVKDGDTLYIGVNNSNWPSMNEGAEENIYKINIVFDKTTLLGDVNNDGFINVMDVTQIQKNIVLLISFTDEQKVAADFNKDGIINVLDVTTLQKYIVKLK